MSDEQPELRIQNDGFLENRSKIKSVLKMYK